MITTPSVATTTAEQTAVIHLVIPGRDMPTHMDPAIRELLAVLTRQGIAIAGPMFSYHHRRPSDTFDFEMGFPVTSPVSPDGRVVNGHLPALSVARTIYTGPYEGLATAWSQLQRWVREATLTEDGRFFERYLTN